MGYATVVNDGCEGLIERGQSGNNWKIVMFVGPQRAE
jgi:hypothetical protein